MKTRISGGGAVSPNSHAWDGTSDNVTYGGGQPQARFRRIGSNISIAPDAQYPWPETQVRNIRRYVDPGFVPLHRTVRMQDNNTNGLWVFHHHGVGRWDPKQQQPDLAVVNATRVLSGYGSDFKANIVERWFENKMHIKPGTVRFANNLPAPFIPWGEWVYTWAIENARDMDATEKKRLMREMEQREEAKREAAERHDDDERDNINRGEGKWRKDLIDKLDPQDYKEMVARQTGAHVDRPTKDYSFAVAR